MPSSLRYPFQKANRKCLLPLNLASGYRYPCSFPTLQNCFYIKAAPCGLLWVWSCRLRKVMSSQFCSQVLHSTLQRALCSLTFSVSAVISFFSLAAFSVAAFVPGTYGIFLKQKIYLLPFVPLWRSHCHQDPKKFTWYSPLLYSHMSLVAEQFSCKILGTET